MKVKECRLEKPTKEGAHSNGSRRTNKVGIEK